MAPGRQHPRPGLGVRPVAALVAGVFALMAIHGPATHDLAHQGSAAAALTSAVIGDDHAALGHGAGPGVDGGRSGVPGVEGSPEAICFVLLCLVTGLLLLTLRRGIPVRALLVLGRDIQVPLPRGRLAEGPCLQRLSILRC